MHKSVLLQEAIRAISPKMGGAYIDATLGAGGHAEMIQNSIGTTGKLLGIDQDETALEISGRKLKGENVTLAWGNFSQITEIAQENGFSKVDGIIADLGVSSMQFDLAERGFSFKRKGKLDMRMNSAQELTAADIVNSYSKEMLTEIFYKYGEEPFAKKIATEIIREREKNPIIWTDQLAEVVRGVKRTQKVRNIRNSKVDPATKVFQALRIEVNKELSALESALPQMVSLLKKQGRLVIISFHSLEDRIVKKYIERESKECLCPPESPKCVCNHRPKVKKITKKPIIPTETEIKENPRARSAKMRVVEKI